MRITHTILSILFIFVTIILTNNQSISADALSNIVQTSDIIEKRTENKKVYIKNGEVIEVYYTNIIHYKNDYKNKNEKWKDIDLTIVNNKITNAPYILEISNNEYIITNKKYKESLTIIGDGDIIPFNTGFALRRIINNSTEINNKADRDFFIYRNGLSISVYSRAYDSTGKEIFVNSSFKNNILSENIDKNQFDNVVYPVYIDPIIDVQIDSSNNDGLRYTGFGGGYTTTQTLPLLGYYAGTWLNLHQCFRFASVNISGTINTAYLEIFSEGPSVGSPELQIYGVDENNPNAPTNTSEFDSVSLTSNSVSWDGAFATYQWVQSPSIVDIIQELANTYTINNDAVMFQIKNDGVSTTNYNKVRHYDYSSSYGAKLYIEYSSETPIYIYPQIIIWW